MKRRIEKEIGKVLEQQAGRVLLEQLSLDAAESWTGADLTAAAAALQEVLINTGVQPGDRVILLAGSSPPAVAAMLGGLQAEATVVFIDPQLPDAELAALIRQSDASLLLSDTALSPLSAAAAGTVPLLSLAGEARAGAPAQVPPRSAEDSGKDAGIAFILYTSGTTGAARGVLLSHEAVLGAMIAVGDSVHIEASERNLCLLPIYHVFGLVQNILLSLQAGVCSGFVDSPAALVSGMPRFRPTMISAVPLQLRHLHAQLAQPGPIPVPDRFRAATGGRLRRVITGGAALDPALRASLESLQLTVIQGYGLSETAGAVSIVSESGKTARQYPGVELKIDQPDASGRGEILVRGPMLFSGYFRDPAAGADVMASGWLRTGDLGSLDAEGRLELLGRSKELIVTEGGEKASPAEVEKHYRDIPGMIEIAVFALPGPDGDHVHAAVVPDPERSTDPDFMAGLEAAVQRRAAELRGPCRIERIHLLPELPKTCAGKVRRYLLREQFADDLPAALPDAPDSESFVLDELASILGRTLDPDRPFADHGLDSLQAAELADRLGRRLSRPIAPTIFWEQPTPARLAAFLGEPAPRGAPEEHASAEDDAIAVVGISCRFPDAPDLGAFWDLLCRGRDPVRPMSAERQALLGRESGLRAAFLEHIEQFDPLFFGISPREAGGMDPQHRLWLELCWEALAHAGIRPGELAGSDTAVFAGAGPGGYGNLLRGGAMDPIITGNAAGALSGRVAYLLDLHGPCETVDTACSSALVAIHRACRSLHSGETSCAIAGAVNLLLDLDSWSCLEQAGMMAGDARCKTFDAGADGYVRGEGGGVVLLQRLGDARREGRRILGIIRASAVNQDGASNGLTAPSGAAQSRLLRACLDRAGLQPQDIDLIECHGTGTRLGDPIEVNAIHSVYAAPPAARSGKPPLLLGAVKSNIGHLEAAAGMPGFIKTLLALAHRRIPPNLHFHTANPLLPLDDLALADRARDWPDSGAPARAGVSSFGFTGTNCHLIVEAGEAGTEMLEPLLPAPEFNRRRCWIPGPAEAARVDPEALVAGVCGILETQLGLEPGGLDPQASLVDYGADSMNMVEALHKLERQFGRRLDPEKLYQGIETAAAIAAWIAESKEAAPSPDPSGGADQAAAVAQASVLPVRLPGESRTLDARQQRFLSRFVGDYTARTAGSKSLAARNRPVLADQRAVSGFAAWKKELVYPVHARSAKGAVIEDVDGNGYVDIALEFGANLFGHQPDFLRDAIRAYLESPLPLAAHNEMAGEVAGAIADITGVERVCILTTGSEAVMSALRIARAATGRQGVAMFRWSYHGAHDQVLAHPGSDGGEPLLPGIHAGALQDLLLLDYGQPDALARLEAEAGSLAAILVEPVQSRHPDLQPGEFLKALRRISDRSGAVLVFDEVITGFRCHPGGAQAWFGVDADLVVYGKIIGGGYPLAAVAGASRLMNHIDGGPWQYGDDSGPDTRQTFVGGTYNGHPIALAAARAVLDHLRAEGPRLQEQLNERCKDLCARLNRFFVDENAPLKVEQFSSLFRFAGESSDTDLFYAGLRYHGVYATEVRNCFLSTAHGDAEISAIEDAVRKTTRMLHQGGFLASAPAGAKPGTPSPKLPAEASRPNIIRLGGSSGPRLRLFCLPYAGGGSRPYRAWAERLPPGVELLYLQLPGREGQSDQAPFRDFEELLDGLCPVLEEGLNGPAAAWALFGHSMGAILAFELARRMARRTARRTAAVHPCAGLLVSGENPPDSPQPARDPAALGDRELIDQVLALGGGSTAESIRPFLPTLRADLEVCASYRYRAGPLLDCPLVAFGGDADPLVPFAGLDRWSRQTRGRFSLRQLAGAHFFLESDRDRFVASLGGELEQLLHAGSGKNSA